MLSLFARDPEELQAEEGADEEAGVALFVRLEAKPGREIEVEDLLRSGLPMVEREPGTTSWFGMRLGESSYGIFDTFPNDGGRQAHLAGQVARALKERGPDLFARPPVIERIDIIACKL